MNEKLCYTCKEVKPVTEFNKNKSRADGLNSICRSCSKARSKQYYSENKEKHIQVIGRRKAAATKEARDFVIDYLQTHPCIDCGNTDIRVLEFDHLNDKSYNVSQMISGGYSLSTIQKEIAKCEVVCANCHRIRTYEKTPSYRSLLR